MARLIRTFPSSSILLHQGSRPKAMSPFYRGRSDPEAQEVKGSHLLGPCWGQQGDCFCPTLCGQAGRRQFLSWQMHLHGQVTHAYIATPGLTPGSRQACLRACRAGEGGGQGPHSGWRGAISGSHWAEELPGNTWILQLEVNMSDITRSGHWPHKPSRKETSWVSFSLLWRYPWTSKSWMSCWCREYYVSSSVLLQTMFKNPTGIYWHFKMARGQILAV